MRLVVSLVTLAITCSVTFAGEDEFYRRFLSLIETNNPTPQGVSTSLLVDTNNRASKITGTLDLGKLKEQDGVAGVRLGMTMEQVAEKWGKPVWLWSRCFDGMPTMTYTDVMLGFEGNSLKALRFNTYGIQFDKGVSAASSMDDCEKELGLPVVRRGSNDLGSLMYASRKARMTLQFHGGRITTVRLAKPDPARSDWSAVQYGERGPFEPNKMPDSADFNRAAIFFGPTTNKWGAILLSFYERILTQIHEPSIFMERTNVAKQEYRLILLGRMPVILHFSGENGSGALRTYRWSGDTPSFADPPLTVTTRVSPVHWPTFQDKLRAVGFWAKDSCPMDGGKDGYRVVLEVLDKGKYHLVDRFAHVDEAFETLCWDLIHEAPEIPEE